MSSPPDWSHSSQRKMAMSLAYIYPMLIRAAAAFTSGVRKSGLAIPIAVLPPLAIIAHSFRKWNHILTDPTMRRNSLHAVGIGSVG